MDKERQYVIVPVLSRDCVEAARSARCCLLTTDEGLCTSKDVAKLGMVETGSLSNSRPLCVAQQTERSRQLTADTTQSKFTLRVPSGKSKLHGRLQHAQKIVEDKWPGSKDIIYGISTLLVIAKYIQSGQEHQVGS